VGLTFSIYTEQQGGATLWMETHNVEMDAEGHYSVLLGSQQSEGMPIELFATGDPRWLGVKVELPGEVEQARVLLVSVPYALKASDADTLGGKPASAYALAPTDAAAGTGTTAASATGAATSSNATPTGKKPGSAGPQTMNFIPMYTDSSGDTGNSVMQQSGTSIGVGTVPGVTFDVNGGVRGTGLATAGRGVSTDAINTGSLFLGGSNAMALVGTGTAAFASGALFTQATFSAGGAVRMTVNGSNGFVGIGTATPGQMLDVAGGVRGTGLASRTVIGPGDPPDAGCPIFCVTGIMNKAKCTSNETTTHTRNQLRARSSS